MFGIEFQAPLLFWVGIPLVLSVVAALAYANLLTVDSVRRLWGDQVMLDQFTPRDKRQSYSLWAQWIALVAVLLLACAGPNISQTPQMVPAGAVQVVFMYDTSPSMGAEDNKSYMKAPPGVDSSAQWGTRLDLAKQLTRQLLPQLGNNEAGLITVMGAGFNMWDITRDLSSRGAFNHMLDKFVKLGAAPGAGADYANGLLSALAEFEVISEHQKKHGDTAEKVKFIVFFTDGGFTGDPKALDEALDKVKQANVRLLVVGIGGNAPITVPKYNDQGRRSGEFYAGDTKLETKWLFRMKDRAGADLILVNPGTTSIEYSFPQKAGGLYARPSQSNVTPWLLLAALVLFVSITTGGGGRPRLQMIMQDLRALRVRAGAFVSRMYRRGKGTGNSNVEGPTP